MTNNTSNCFDIYEKPENLDYSNKRSSSYEDKHSQRTTYSQKRNIHSGHICVSPSVSSEVKINIDLRKIDKQERTFRLNEKLKNV